MNTSRCSTQRVLAIDPVARLTQSASSPPLPSSCALCPPSSSGSSSSHVPLDGVHRAADVPSGRRAVARPLYHQAELRRKGAPAGSFPTLPSGPWCVCVPCAICMHVQMNCSSTSQPLPKFVTLGSATTLLSAARHPRPAADLRSMCLGTCQLLRQSERRWVWDRLVQHGRAA